ncbi:interleukin-6 receptor subunit alpha isoform X2 [Echeneis naucrates]|uniref:Interleukin-6 receptor subunit alpha-like n=1 Tax=Echeneis naucrates TaxID=173247 RepID=A0A665V0K2_ECHNA|nr:interleukin-6 receptor subunit alpha-like isoform X2 [Echeneis naucrates]
MSSWWRGIPAGKMQLFLPLLCVLCAARVHSIFDGACPRKDAPPGVLVVTPGSNLILKCKGHVLVNGVRVNITQKSSNTNGGRTSSVVPTTTANITRKKRNVDSTVDWGYNSKTEEEVRTATEENQSARYITYTASPISNIVQPTSTGGPQKNKSNWDAEELDSEDDYEEDEEEISSRVTRGIKSRHEWSWNNKAMGSGRRDWGDIKLERRGSTLSLSSVRMKDSGKYSCHYRGREVFSVKVSVVEPPESPSLSCYKRSPSSKIRCEWAPQKPVTRPLYCYLVLNKSPSQLFINLPCSYSSRLSRCWCALEHSEDDLRTLYTAFLCVTNMAGNASSAQKYFKPLDILQPDPPSNIKVTQLERHMTWLKVNWYLPTSWNIRDQYYELKYEVKYQPVESSSYQVHLIRDTRSLIIKDVVPGAQYLIQIRARDEYDGQWSDWSTTIIGSSWTASPATDDQTNITSLDESGSGDNTTEDDPAPKDGPAPKDAPESVEVPHILWICASFVFLLPILAVYIFRRRDRVISKLHCLNVGIKPLDSSEVPHATTTAPEEHALVAFTPPCYKEPPSKTGEKEEGENEEEQRMKDRINAMHFNNTTYFFIQRE